MIDRNDYRRLRQHPPGSTAARKGVYLTPRFRCIVHPPPLLGPQGSQTAEGIRFVVDPVLTGITEKVEGILEDRVGGAEWKEAERDFARDSWPRR